MENNLRVPIEKVFIRPSEFGLLIQGVKWGDVGLSEAKKLISILKKQKFYKELTYDEKNLADRYETYLTSKEYVFSKKDIQKLFEIVGKPFIFKVLSNTDKNTFSDISEKLSQIPYLTDGGKTTVEKIWLRYEKGFKETFSSKEVEKGNEAEDASIALIDELIRPDDIFLKNTELKNFNHLRGICDVFRENEKIIDEIKTSWSAYTFLKSELKKTHEWQTKAYIYMWGAKYGFVHYCLVNTPPGLIQSLLFTFFQRNNAFEQMTEENKKLYIDFFRSHIYDLEDFDNRKNEYPEDIRQIRKELDPLYTKEERVKSYKIELNGEDIWKIETAIKLALEYYQTISLNKKD